jgi:hypothetical protein
VAASRCCDVADGFGYQSEDICVLADIDMTVVDGTFGGVTAEKSRWPSKENIVSSLTISKLNRIPRHVLIPSQTGKRFELVDRE